jgi:hypothetical protein
MQPRNLLLATALVPLLGLDEDDDGLLAEAQAASSKVALTTPTVMIDFLNSYLLEEGSAGAAAMAAGYFPPQPARAPWLPPNGISRRVDPPAIPRKERADLLVLPMPN